MRTLALIFMYLTGAALVIAGLALIYVPFALVGAGVIAVRAAFILDTPTGADQP